MDFYQTAPQLSNQYEDDRTLKSFLKRALPQNVFEEIEKDLHHFGERVATDILKLGEEAEKCEPVHIPYSPWGKRIDEIQVSEAWSKLDRISAEEGLIAIGYERKYGQLSRLYQLAKLYLFHPSSAIYSCPLAMTDGAARVIEMHGSEEMKKKAFKHLTSTNPDKFWTSGQWMTERTGGSDVSQTSTIAKWLNGAWQLHGVKWFTSATTSQMAMTLAKIEGDESGKLSLFYVELRNSQGELQNIQVNRLKDKLGTRALPTAELTLTGTPAILVGEKNKGVKTIATLFNITRIYNACCAVGYMRRGIALARDYAGKRSAFGRLLKDHALHVEMLSDLQVRFEASFHLTFHAVKLLGKEESGQATPQESGVLRLLIPLAKLFTGKEVVSIASEVVESFGGAGYVEDTGIPQLLRNSQVLSIWEGTTNVLSLDSLRAIKKENAGEAFIQDIHDRLKQIKDSKLNEAVLKIEESNNHLKMILSSLSSTSEEDLNASGRILSLGLAKTYAASLLAEHAEWELSNENNDHTLLVLQRWVKRGLFQDDLLDQEAREISRRIVF
jgi:putative acyl-CoA dehydrogenase